MIGQLSVRILGPLEVWHGETQVALGAAKPRTLLAVLILNPTGISRDALIDALWGERPPSGARNTLQVYVSSLRRALGRKTIETIPTGYRLRLESDALDAERFEHLVRTGRDALASGDSAGAAYTFAEALALWHGPALADFRYDGFAQAESGRLEELRLVCLEERIEAELALGRHAALVGELEATVVEQPLRERLRGQLILALYRSGRQGDALAAYQAARRMLSDELGLEPSPELRELQRLILAQDASLAPPSPVTARVSGTVTFMFTDIEGSTGLLKRVGRERYAELLALHQALLREVLATHRGEEIDSQGDSFFVTFRGASDAVLAAMAIQRSLADHEWPEDAGPRVRIGIHSGEATAAGERYLGFSVHRAARISDAGHGGQVLLSDATRALVEDDLPAGVHLRDLGVFGLKDVDRPERIFQVIADGLQVEFPPLRGSRPSNLPLQPTPFIGRKRELAELVDVVRGAGRRLVTLTGPGGSGKSRLAGEAAFELAGDYPDGVWWVPLQSLTDPNLVLPTIAGAIGATGDVGPAIGTKQMLLVLDNFEQLLAARSDLAAILADCPSLRVLATSREPLNVTAEREFRVPPMTEADAVALFDERAVDAGPAEVRASVCRRLDCLPLAVELAAARTRAFTPEQILGRLDDRLSFLGGGPHDAPARHQTLRATIDWSYGLLTAEDQQLFEQLGVFAGSWDLAAAEAVCEPDGASPALADGVMSLIEKSLVTREPAVGGQSYYSMLETIRSYALENLRAKGELTAVERRHAEYFLAGFELAHRIRFGEEVIPEDDAEGGAARPGDPANLRGALRFALEEDDLELALRLAAAGIHVWTMSGAMIEGQAWMTSVLSHANAVRGPSRADALLSLGTCERILGNPRAAAQQFDEARNLSEVLGDSRGVLKALIYLIELTAETNDPDHERLLPAASSLADEIGNDVDRARLLIAEAGTRARSGDFGGADEMLGKGVELMRHSGVPPHLWAWQLVSAGYIAMELQDFERARSAFAEYLAATSAKHPIGTATAYCNLGLVALYEHQRDAASDHLRHALVLARDTEAKVLITECLYGLAAVAAMDADPEQAVRLWGAAATLKDATSITLSTPERFIVAEYLEPARAEIADEIEEVTRIEGAAMSLEEAVASALDEGG